MHTSTNELFSALPAIDFIAGHSLIIKIHFFAFENVW